MSKTEDVETAVHKLERRRCELLVNGDVARLEKLLADNLVHIHLNGHVDDKAAYLLGISEKFAFKALSRGALTVRVFWGCSRHDRLIDANPYLAKERTPHGHQGDDDAGLEPSGRRLCTQYLSQRYAVDGLKPATVVGSPQLRFHLKRKHSARQPPLQSSGKEIGRPFSLPRRRSGANPSGRFCRRHWR